MENKNNNDDDNMNLKSIETTEDGQKVIPLEYPFMYGDERVTEIKIPRIKAHHMRGINGKKLDEGDLDEMFKLIQALIGNGRKYVDNLDMVDIQRTGAVIQSFFPNGPTTGKIA